MISFVCVFFFFVKCLYAHLLVVLACIPLISVLGRDSGSGPIPGLYAPVPGAAKASNLPPSPNLVSQACCSLAIR